MTVHYLTGEMSLLLANLQTVAESAAAAAELHRLRYRAETAASSSTLTAVADHALRLIDSCCWVTLNGPAPADFSRQAEAAAALWEFCLCARLLDPQTRW